eukprot:322168-Amorphochlora_amoeboformis.AAC.1
MDEENERGRDKWRQERGRANGSAGKFDLGFPKILPQLLRRKLYVNQFTLFNRIVTVGWVRFETERNLTDENISKYFMPKN